ncbi:cupin domain-containing protein [Pedobacter chinensis]|uniref:Cupin domain-containing protein n=1 Tax=Pedobacter chinensis TaxID=2282421 RepID=A0A369PV23_9SPHI|nr:cupin domain-containing protein [Pedobacter chinensis]RDC54549.1 cupin domain-containing protein [Pedobacter chinensis]
MKYLQTMIAATVLILGTSCGNPKKENNMETPVPKISDFPVGEENKAFAQYFSGRSWLAPLTTNKDLNVPMNNVTFEPGCRNNWHSHTGGQILIAAGGTGYYQERGKAAVRMEPGDVIEIAPNVEHWHGAAPDSWFSHIAITSNPQTNENKWLEPVTDEQYAEAVK